MNITNMLKRHCRIVNVKWKGHVRLPIPPVPKHEPPHKRSIADLMRDIVLEDSYRHTIKGTGNAHSDS